MKQIWIQTTAFLCAILFIMVGLSKLMGYTDFLNSLQRSPLIGKFAMWLSIPLPIIEIAAGMALLIPKYRKYGFVAISIMMVTFTSYNFYLVKYAPHVPCSCGGIFSHMSWTNHLYVNTAFTMLALSGWLLSRKYLYKYQ